MVWIEVEKGNYEEGRDLAERALAINAEDAKALDTLGVALTQLDRLEEAKAALNKAVAVSRGSRPFIVFHLAQLHEAAGDNAQALKILEDLQPILEDLPESLAEQIAQMIARLQ